MSSRRSITLLLGGVLVALPWLALAQEPAAGAPAPGPARPAPSEPRPGIAFPTPEFGFAAMAKAARAHDERQMLRILGEAARPLVHSGDPAADRAGFDRFADAYDEKAEIFYPAPDRAVLQIGKDDWPLPIPMIRRGGTWHFDPSDGVQEMVNRRIGRNELDTIQVLLAIVDAQDEYARTTGRQGGFQIYARRLFSTPGTHDGLYWATEPGESPSPLGPLAAAASGVVRGADDKPTPYHGYIFRLLERQGPNAPGGEMDYVVGGRLIGGFGVIATPAQYGVTGIQTFLVSHSGVVYERNLGPGTSRIAPGITAYDPGPGWQKIED